MSLDRFRLVVEKASIRPNDRHWFLRWVGWYVKTTQIYTHVLNRPGISVKSPLDRQRAA